MKLEDIIQSRIEKYLNSIGHDEPLPTFNEQEAKKMLSEIAFDELRELEYIDVRDLAVLYKVQIDLIRARQGEEISFRKKHMCD